MMGPVGGRGGPRWGITRRAPLATWVLSTTLLVATSTGCAVMERSELVESAPEQVEPGWLHRPGSVQAVFDPVSAPAGPDATSTTTTLPTSTTTVMDPPATALRRIAPPPATTPTEPPNTSPSTTATPAPAPTIPPTVMATNASADARIDRALALVQIDWADMLPGWTFEFRGP